MHSDPFTEARTGIASKLIDRLRTLLAPAVNRKVKLAAPTLLNAQIWIDQVPWRTNAFWSAGAAWLAAGASWPAERSQWQQIALWLLLVDVLWGSIWRIGGGRAALLPLSTAAAERQPWIPYLQAASPAARLFGGDHTDVWPFAFRIGLPSVLLATGVAMILGRTALLFTAALVLITALAWTVRRTAGGIPVVLESLAAVGLPWGLGISLLAPALTDRQWLAQWTIVGLWTMHHWGESRVISFAQDWLGLGLMAVAEIALCLLLIGAKAPLWLVLLAVLFLPAWMAVYRRQALAPLRVLWLAAMLISALALGQAM